MTQVKDTHALLVSQKSFAVDKAIHSGSKRNRRYAQGFEALLNQMKNMVANNGCYLRLSDTVYRDITSEVVNKLALIEKWALYGQDPFYSILYKKYGIVKELKRADIKKGIRKNRPVIFSRKQMQVINSRYNIAFLNQQDSLI